MKSVQEYFRDSEGWGGWFSKELTSAFKVSGLAHGHRHYDLTGDCPRLLSEFGLVHSRVVLSSLGGSTCEKEGVSL